MLSNVIITQIEAAVPALTKGVNLFAEKGKGDAFVLVKTTIEQDIEPTIREIRRASIQLYLTGYAVQAGKVLADSCSQAIEQLMGDYAYETEGYHIYSVLVKNRPAAFGLDDLKWTANFEVNFRVS